MQLLIIHSKNRSECCREKKVNVQPKCIDKELRNYEEMNIISYSQKRNVRKTDGKEALKNQGFWSRSRPEGY